MSSGIEKAAVLFFLVALLVMIRRTERWLKKSSKILRLTRQSQREARASVGGYGYGLVLMLVAAGSIFYLRGAP